MAAAADFAGGNFIHFAMANRFAVAGCFVVAGRAAFINRDVGAIPGGSGCGDGEDGGEGCKDGFHDDVVVKSGFESVVW